MEAMANRMRTRRRERSWMRVVKVRVRFGRWGGAAMVRSCEEKMER
jgi:hypothetical protein